LIDEVSLPCLTLVLMPFISLSLAFVERWLQYRGAVLWPSQTTLSTPLTTTASGFLQLIPGICNTDTR
jgi:hypothetical protein